MIDRVEFKCLFAVVIDRFQLQQDEKREVVDKAGLAWGHPLRLGRQRKECV